MLYPIHLFLAPFIFFSFFPSPFKVFDEFHYMNDPSRGTVWEESVISSPTTLQMIALSATVSNVDDIVGWFNSTHGPTELVSSDFRYVPTTYHKYQRCSSCPIRCRKVEVMHSECLYYSFTLIQADFSHTMLAYSIK